MLINIMITKNNDTLLFIAMQSFSSYPHSTYTKRKPNHPEKREKEDTSKLLPGF